MSRLDEVWEWYEAARDSLRIVRSLLETQPDAIPPSLAAGTVFETQPRSEVLQRLRQAEQELDDLTIVALWASFEQQVLDHLEQAVQRTLKQKRRDRLQQRILQERLAKPRYWRFEEVLDLYKEIIDPQLVGDVKQVLQYRNWVAHGRTSRMPPNIIPRIAYERLKDFLGQLNP